MGRALASAAVIILVSGCALGSLVTKGRSYPQLSGERTAEGLEGPLTIHRDRWGIPHIRAGSARDGWWAVGFVHAQDRLFQADLNRRVVFGGLAEWQGEEAADFDGFVRGLALRAQAQRSFAALTPEAREALVAYAEGLNAGAASLGALPVEYRLMGVPFEPWRPEDGLAPTYMASLLLAKNPVAELNAFMLRDRLDWDQANVLLRSDDAEPPLDTYWDTLRGLEVGELTAGYRAVVEGLGVGNAEASNNWVVGPSRSADGKPILANDPHLPQRVPSIWYVAEVLGGDLHVAGGTFPGSPFVLTGHDGQVAWGVTNTMADYVDFAVVELRDGGYVLGGERHALREVRVEVPLAGGHVTERIMVWTEVGPLITDADAPYALALRWHALELLDRTADMLEGLSRARRVEDGLRVANLPSIISQNVVFADTQGRFGWVVSGVVPVRRAHTGRVPYPAFLEGQGWDGWQSELPRDLDPERGYVQTANNRPDHPAADAVASSFIPRWRWARIGQLLEPLTAATVADMLRIQLDVLDLHAVTLLGDLLDGYAPASPDAQRCHALLTEWDREGGRDTPGPTVFAQLQKELLQAALVDELGEAGLDRYHHLAAFDDSILRDRLERFLPHPEQALEPALDRTCKALTARYGGDVRRWRWGRVHPLRLTHPFDGRSVFLNGWSYPEVPWPGTMSTVAQAGYHLGSDDWRTQWMPSLRIVTPLGDPGAARVSYPGGQSGQPGHRWYRSLWDVWLANETVPLCFDDPCVAAETVETLRLHPAPAGSAGP